MPSSPRRAKLDEPRLAAPAGTPRPAGEEKAVHRAFLGRAAELLACLVRCGVAAAVLWAGGCGGGSSCALDGRWTGFVQLGAWQGALIKQHFEPAAAYILDVSSTSFTGTWSVQDDVVTISDGSCTTADPGLFQLKWVDCTQFIYHTLDDACPSRGETLNGVTMTYSHE